MPIHLAAGVLSDVLQACDPFHFQHLNLVEHGSQLLCGLHFSTCACPVVAIRFLVGFAHLLIAAGTTVSFWLGYSTGPGPDKLYHRHSGDSLKGLVGFVRSAALSPYWVGCSEATPSSLASAWFLFFAAALC